MSVKEEKLMTEEKMDIFDEYTNEMDIFDELVEMAQEKLMLEHYNNKGGFNNKKEQDENDQQNINDIDIHIDDAAIQKHQHKYLENSARQFKKNETRRIITTDKEDKEIITI